jgi:hypothetical protein
MKVTIHPAIRNLAHLLFNPPILYIFPVTSGGQFLQNDTLYIWLNDVGNAKRGMVVCSASRKVFICHQAVYG